MFSAVVLEEAEQSENEVDDDEFKINWRFERANDGISAILSKLDITYQNLTISFERSNDEIHYMFINGERSQFSAKVSNLIMTKYYIHYDIEINNRLAELLNELLKVFLTKRVQQYKLISQ